MTLIDEFLSKKAIYDKCAAKVNSLLGELLSGAGIKVHQSSFRVKTADSLESKIKRKGYKYIALSEITDLVGLRVITYYDDDVDLVASLIEKEFVVDEVNSIDKRKAHDPDRFGYMSLHYIASLSGGRCGFPEYRDFSGMKFEIQVRTLLQHAWAEIEHDLGYKSDREIPAEFRRRFSRVSSFLEEADESFVRIRNGIGDYLIESEKKIKIPNEDLLIDKITIGLLCKNSEMVKMADALVAKKYRAELDENEVVPVALEFLEQCKIQSIVKLEGLLEGNVDRVAMLAEYFQNLDDSHGYGNSIKVSRGISLFLLCYILSYQSGGEDAVLNWLQRSSEEYEGEFQDMLDAVKKVCE